MFGSRVFFQCLHIVCDDVFKGLAENRKGRFAVIDHRDGKSSDPVIIGRHRIVISARGGNRAYIAAANGGRNHNVLLNYVAAFTASADDGAFHIALLIHFVGDINGV